MSTEPGTGIAFLRNIGLMMTYRCQAACPHCVVGAGPHRTEEVSLEEALGWISQMAAYRDGHIAALSLTGGEPFCCFEKLKQTTRHAAQLGMIVTTVTNGFWATTVSEAVSVLAGLEGLKMIGISADPHHQAFIPFDRVKNAVAAARECGLEYRIIVTCEDDTSPEYRAFRARLEEVSPEEHIQPVTTFLAGRAKDEIDGARCRTSSTPCQSRCEAAGSPVVFPNGQVVACIGALIALPTHHPLVLGNLRQQPLREILDKAEGNAILHGLRVWGPARLVSMIEESEAKSELPDRYVDDVVCDPCYRIMSNGKLAQWAERLAADPEYMRTVAYGRAYFLNETDMLGYLGWQ